MLQVGQTGVVSRMVLRVSLILVTLTGLAAGCGNRSGGTGDPQTNAGSPLAPIGQANAKDPGKIICANGVCSAPLASGGSCATGLTLCSGVCVNEQSDPNNCGNCGHICNASQVCTLGKCIDLACPPGTEVCNRTCVTTATDVNNCGTCNDVCRGPISGSGSPVCSNGSCGITCMSGTPCNGACVNTASDVHNCGACGHTCPSGDSCVNGVCVASCTGVLTNCNGVCVNQQIDNDNCGACGNHCPAGQVCSLGVCCASGFTNCS